MNAREIYLEPQETRETDTVKELQGKQQKKAEGEAKEAEAKEGEAKEGEAKEAEAKEGEAKEAEAKEAEAKEAEAKEGEAKEGESLEKELEEKFQFEEVSFDLNAFSRFKLAGTPEQNEAAENKAKELSKFLLEIMIPQIFAESLSWGSIYDGTPLVQLMHESGINVRYLGAVAGVLATKVLPFNNTLYVNAARFASFRFVSLLSVRFKQSSR
jgi:hypothetical protein